MSLVLMYITNSLEVALLAQDCGVDRIWIDLETLGKEGRQRGIDTVKSNHTIDDIKKIKPQLNTSEMLVRINHWHDGSMQEIDNVVEAGADIIMLPYWKTAEEVKRFTDSVNGRCKTTLLLETKEAVSCIEDVLKMGGFDEIHIGLNDLHLSYGMTFMFELLADGTVERLCKKFRSSGIPYGFGGIAKLGDGLLPAEMIIMEHYRLGSTRAILSRSFCDYTKYVSSIEIEKVFNKNIVDIRRYEDRIREYKEEALIENKNTVCKMVNIIKNEETKRLKIEQCNNT